MELGTLAPPIARYRRTIADRVPLRDIMTPDVICVRPDLDIHNVVSLVVKHHLGCLPVVDERRRPIGMITKFDLVEQLEAAMESIANDSPLPSDLSARNADEVMMPIALVLDENATIAHAASLMTSEDTHHVIVVRGAGELAGVVSTKDIVSWLVENDGLVPNTSDVEPCVPPPWYPLETD
ncbi:MAG TPA: CBS domain-containing protein [Kofleriaceae bacterium]|nr:CBS domain-containing protein [Kofleriaceae bacterium]